MTDFDILGVDPEADAGTINKAFRKLVKQYHPDVHPNPELAKKKILEIIEARDNITSGNPNLSRQSEKKSSEQEAPSSGFRDAYARRTDEPRYERYQYRTWGDQAADEQARRDTELKEAKSKATERLQQALQQERRLRARSIYSTRDFDEDAFSDQVEGMFSVGAAGRGDALKSYAAFRRHALMEEMNSSPPDRTRYAKELAVLNNPSASELFERSDRLTAALGNYEDSDLSKSVLKDLALVRDGMISKPDTRRKFLMSAILAQRALAVEESIISKRAAEKEHLSPEEKFSYAKSQVFNLANGVSKDARAINDSKSSIYSTIAAQATSLSDDFNEPGLIEHTQNAQRLAGALSVDRLSKADYFDRRDAQYLHARSIERISFGAQREAKIIFGDVLFPTENYAKLSQTRASVAMHATMRTDALERQEKEEGLLGKFARKLENQDSLATRSALAEQNPFSADSMELNREIATDRKTRSYTQNSVERFGATLKTHRSLHEKTVEESASRMKRLISADPNGEYLVSRAVGVKLASACEMVKSRAASNPEVSRTVEGWSSQLASASKAQLSSRKLKEIASGLSSMMPHRGELAELHVTLDASAKGIGLLSEAEQKRWTASHFDGERIKREAPAGLSKAYANAEELPEIDREEAGRNLKDTLFSAIKVGRERNPAPKQRPLFEEAGRQYQASFSKGGYSSEAAGLAEAVLRSGLISDSKVAGKIADSIAKVSVGLGRDQAAVDAHLDSMRREEASGRSANEILAERNRRLASEVAKNPTGKATFAAVRESMKKSSDIGARHQEAAAILRATPPVAGGAHVEARANAAYAQEAATNKKRDRRRDGGLDMSA